MFGIGLPEMIVILAVALIVVGPEKLPDMAKNVAKWMFELKKTVNQVKDSLADEDNLIGSVHSDLKKTADDLKGDLIDSDDHFSWHEPGDPSRALGEPDNDVIDMNDLQAVDTEKDEKNADPVAEGDEGSQEEIKSVQEEEKQEKGDSPEKNDT